MRLNLRTVVVIDPVRTVVVIDPVKALSLRPGRSSVVTDLLAPPGIAAVLPSRPASGAGEGRDRCVLAPAAHNQSSCKYIPYMHTATEVALLGSRSADSPLPSTLGASWRSSGLEELHPQACSIASVTSAR